MKGTATVDLQDILDLELAKNNLEYTLKTKDAHIKNLEDCLVSSCQKINELAIRILGSDLKSGSELEDITALDIRNNPDCILNYSWSYNSLKKYGLSDSDILSVLNYYHAKELARYRREVTLDDAE